MLIMLNERELIPLAGINSHFWMSFFCPSDMCSSSDDTFCPCCCCGSNMNEYYSCCPKVRWGIGYHVSTAQQKWTDLMFFWPCIMNWLYINYQLDALIIIYSSNNTLLYMFRASSAHLQEDTVVHMQHAVLSLSTRVLGGLSVHSVSENWL